MGRLDDKVALITGAASGMGRVACEVFAREGAKVAALDVVDPSETVQSVQRAGGEIFGLSADITDPDAVEAAVTQVVATFGHLEVLYNNAGISPGDDGDALETSVETWERTMDVNVKGSWLCARAALPALRSSGAGSIVNVASFVAWMGAATPRSRTPRPRAPCWR